MTVPLLDLVAQYRTIQPEVDEAIHQVLVSGQFVLGPNVAALEQEVATYLGVKYAVGVASGTDALVLALRTLGIRPGDEVIVPTYTFFATAGAVMLVGATPVLVDVEPDTLCLDVRQVAERITARTKAIVPVHLYGHPADMDPLMALAEEHGVFVVEDCAQATGARYRLRQRRSDEGWVMAGSIGHIGCLSFYPTKNLGGYGDGGMVVTDDAEMAEQIRMLRTHGWRRKYYPEMLGYNSRLDELQAAVLRVKLRHLDSWNERRRELAGRYTEQLSNIAIGVPYEAPNARHVYHLYVIWIKERDRVQQVLRERGVASAIYYPQPLHLATPCQSLGFKQGDFPVAERASEETLAIPVYPDMTTAQVDEVVGVLRDALC